MEHIIANRLSNPEVGKLTRRELIKNLGITVTAAPFIRSARAMAFEDKKFKAIAVNHISYQVEDYAKTRDFYASLLGMTPYLDTGKQCNLAFGDTYIVVHNRRSTTSQIDHVAYTIENWDKSAIEAELKRRGLEVRPVSDNPTVL